MKPIRRQMIVEFDDYANEPFTGGDIDNLMLTVQEAMADYDVNVEKITIVEVSIDNTKIGEHPSSH